MISNRPLFIITSSLKPMMGVFSDGERYSQTIRTILSIREKCPNAYIVFADASVRPVGAMEFLSISKMVNFFVRMDEKYNYDILEFSRGKMKSHAETALLYHIFVQMKRDSNLQKALYSTNRIFKISGRLQLEEEFDIKQYNNLFGKYVFRKRISTWMPQPHIVSDLFVTRLFSLCPSLIDDYLGVLQRNYQMLDYVDTEHAHFANINPNYLIEFDKVHCKGQVASTGEWHYD